MTTTAKGAGLITVILFAIIGAIVGMSVSIKTEQTDSGFNAEVQFSERQIPAIIEGDQGELVEDDTIPTVEKVDGGQFKDKDTGVSVVEGMYTDLGWSETYNVSNPEAFKNDTLGKCIIANNYYGAQCVSLARVFWWSYADRDVSTCGTGMAKGMMNCADDNAGDDFVVMWRENINEIQAGDWLVFDGGQFGHVGMALGPVVNGYVALLGENQGGHSCGAGVGGSATNIINISIKNLIGFYRPKSYIKPAPAPAPEPTPEPTADVCTERTVAWGDTMGKIMLECTGAIKWGAEMDTYAKSWVSTKVNPGQTVYAGWLSSGGVGLYAGDIIRRSS